MQELYPIENKVINLSRARLSSKKPISQALKMGDTCFQAPLFQNLTNQLNDFCQTQHSFALVLGPEGSGKTKLLKYFQSSRPHCHLLNHSNGRLTPVSNSDKDSIATTQSTFQQIVNQFSDLHEEVVLLIDDADLLTLDQFQTIMDALNNESNPALKIVLAGEERLSHRVIKLFEHDFTSISYTAIPLTPLSFQEMKDYLKQTYGSSKNDKKILSAKNLEKIYKLSKGYPGRVNNVAAQLLAEMTGRTVKPHLKKKKLWYVDMFILSSIILLLGGITLQVIKQANGFRNEAVQAKVIHGSNKAVLILPPPVENAVPIDNLASPSYIASIEGLPEERPQDDLTLPEPSIFSP